jgi:hypothetical protein
MNYFSKWIWKPTLVVRELFLPSKSLYCNEENPTVNSRPTQELKYTTGPALMP